jgi:hypothetical protein
MDEINAIFPELGESGFGEIRARRAGRNSLRLGGRKRVCVKRTKRGKCKKWVKPVFSGKGKNRRLVRPKRVACKFGVVKTGRRAGQCRKQRRGRRRGRK